MKILQIILAVTFLFSCRTEPSKIPQENRVVTIPKFDSENAFKYIQTQVDFGPRRMNSEAHEKCKMWLVERLREFHFEVQLQDFEVKAYSGEVLHATNIHGIYNKDVHERVLLCAHYDTRHIADKDTSNVDEPIDGADDGASGVAVLLEIARLIHQTNIPMGVDIVFFDAEDHGSDQPNNDYTWGLGSQYWSGRIGASKIDYKYGILLDMVGARDATFRKEGFSVKYASKVVEQIWSLAENMGKGNYFINRETGFITDDHRFIIEKAGIPMVNIINVKADGRFGDYHHKHSDNIEIIYKPTLNAVGQVVAAQIFRESNKQNQ